MPWQQRTCLNHPSPTPLPCAPGNPPQGWNPRTGLQYGADFVLYQRHPALAHSDYAVTIVPLRPSQRLPMGWHDLQISNRLATQVGWGGWVGGCLQAGTHSELRVAGWIAMGWLVGLLALVMTQQSPAAGQRVSRQAPQFSHHRSHPLCPIPARSARSCCCCMCRSRRAVPTAAAPTRWPKSRCTSASCAAGCPSRTACRRQAASELSLPKEWLRWSQQSALCSLLSFCTAAPLCLDPQADFVKNSCNDTGQQHFPFNLAMLQQDCIACCIMCISERRNGVAPREE